MNEPTSEDRPDRSPSDHVLLKRFRDGEQDAATQLFLKYSQRLQALARSQTSEALAARFDPEDVVQSVFRTFFRRASSGLYDVPDGDELWQLLLVLALNKIRDLASHHRAQKRDIGRTDSVAAWTEDASASNRDGASWEVLRVVLDDFLESLPAEHAEIARLRMDGYQVDEISERTRRSKRTTERILNSMRKALLQQMDLDD